MKLIINNEEEFYPSLDQLSEFGVDYQVMDDGKILILLDEKEFRIAENHDVTRKSNVPTSASFCDLSLSYFVIKNRRIIFSGNLKNIKDDIYVCDGPFRIFSNIRVMTYEYVSAGEFDVGEKDSLNKYMLENTRKYTNER